ncbi:GNAT family N-acetyltransferase [Gilvimarinus sp. SDUM040013]|uniref:GNAT family N-acetyltransferase n=1 Tax=Gilvimarinus gilvus TaxID=3058038 RepID=A0ABU4RYW5_9GAMM|nr:GNAT family N-acetyltransferase [Gilvimarinus sp. SDUM040013]MDO3384583.1 GNAT family N-acetyltransferase [Gilvimarinus sp. SDUM040013]MDX6850081.1 GNAT family N-acetyltransferase [Gilvimarinus sp. SDUM040013]
MSLTFKVASEPDACAISRMVVELTEEVTQQSRNAKFTLNHNSTLAKCRALIAQDLYHAVVAKDNAEYIGLASFAESYALYAGGKIGIIQEFYISPPWRSQGIGARLMDQIKAIGQSRDWACIELCTPPLPGLDSSRAFYQRQGLKPVGGRKRRLYLAGC